MNTFFVLLFTCGYLSCDLPKQMDFDNEAACVKFVEEFGYTRGTGFSATCFNKSTGEKLISSMEKRKPKLKDAP